MNNDNDNIIKINYKYIYVTSKVGNHSMLALLKLILCNVSFAYAMLVLHTKSTCNTGFAYAKLELHFNSIHLMHAMCKV